jgi:hypothetical protein
MIGQGGFGYTFGRLDEADNEFRVVIKQYAYVYLVMTVHLPGDYLLSLVLSRMHWPSLDCYSPWCRPSYPQEFLDSSEKVFRGRH